MKAAKWRAKARGVKFDLTRDWVQARLESSVQCEVTGIRFDYTRGSRGRANPFAPSLDRIDPRKGYVRGTVRVVVYIFNVLRLDWGDAVLERFLEVWRGPRELR